MKVKRKIISFFIELEIDSFFLFLKQTKHFYSKSRVWKGSPDTPLIPVLFRVNLASRTCFHRLRSRFLFPKNIRQKKTKFALKANKCRISISPCDAKAISQNKSLFISQHDDRAPYNHVVGSPPRVPTDIQ